MSTGTATALPNPDDQNPPVTGNDPAATPEGQQPGTEPGAGGGIQFLPPEPGDDPDDVALKAAQALVHAEDTEAGAQPEGSTTQGQDPAQAGTTPPAATQPDQRQPAQPAPVMIPKARLDETLQALDKTRLENARLQGMLEATARQTQPAPGQQQQQQQPQQTPAQRIAALRAEKVTLAKDFDDGKFSGSAFMEKQAAIDTQIDQLRDEQLTATLKPNAAPANDELYLETLTAQLETNHPWVKVFDQVGTDADWKFLELKAVENLTAAGKTIDLSKTIDRYNFRKEMSELATAFGPSLVAAKAAAKGIAIPGAQPQQQQQQQQPQLTPAAQTRLKALQRAAGAPPDLAAMTGSIGDPTGAISEERLEHISEEDFDKLPAATRAKLLGTSA
jgi:hypothetical protein